MLRRDLAFEQALGGLYRRERRSGIDVCEVVEELEERIAVVVAAAARD